MKYPLILAIAAIVLVSGCATGAGPAIPGIGQGPETKPKAGDFTGEEPVKETIKTKYPLLFQNNRFAEMPIKVWLDTESAYRLVNFSEKGIQDVRNALGNWTKETNGLIEWEEVDTKENSQVTIEWVGESSFDNAGQVGEGGPKVIDTGRYNLSVGGIAKVELTGHSCLNWVVAMHEIGHVLGLDHVDNRQSIMYKTASCYQKFQPGMLGTIQKLYRDPAKPDLLFTEASAVVTDRVVNVTAKIKNTGIKNSTEVNMTILVGDVKIYTEKLQIIPPATTLTLKLSLPSGKIPKDYSSVTLKIDKTAMDEYDLKNNAVVINV